MCIYITSPVVSRSTKFYFISDENATECLKDLKKLFFIFRKYHFFYWHSFCRALENIIKYISSLFFYLGIFMKIFPRAYIQTSLSIIFSRFSMSLIFNIHVIPCEHASLTEICSFRLILLKYHWDLFLSDVKHLEWRRG